MSFRQTAKWVAGAIAVFVIVSIAVSCAEDTGSDPLPSPPMMVSRGIITASFNRYIETNSDEPFEQFSLMGMFVRHDIEETYTVDSLFDSQTTNIDLALDTCTMPARILDDDQFHDQKNETPIELLDVGDLAASVNKVPKPVPTQTFPDLLKVIVGVIYTADETQGLLYRPGETYDLSAKGTEEVEPFRVALEAPEDLGDVKIDGITPGDQVPVVRRGEELEILWDGDGYGDEVVATLTWMSMGAPWSMTCRMRDDGLFVVPTVVTSGLPDPLTCSDEELTLSRIRQVAFRSAGFSSGSFKFVISTNFPVAF